MNQEPETQTPQEDLSVEKAAPAAKKPAKEFSPSEKKEGVVRKSRVGLVISTKMDKTIVVEYVARVPHPQFKKIVKRTKKFYAHDEKQEAVVGDKVRIAETRPLSKTKCWELIKVLSH